MGRPHHSVSEAGPRFAERHRNAHRLPGLPLVSAAAYPYIDHFLQVHTTVVADIVHAQKCPVIGRYQSLIRKAAAPSSPAWRTPIPMRRTSDLPSHTIVAGILLTSAIGIWTVKVVNKEASGFISMLIQ